MEGVENSNKCENSRCLPFAFSFSGVVSGHIAQLEFAVFLKDLADLLYLAIEVQVADVELLIVLLVRWL